MSGGMEDMNAKAIIKQAAEDVAVNNPPHYNHGKIECIDAIESALTPEEFRGYLKGNIIKYIWREKHKHGLASLKKGEWYLRKLTEFDEPKKCAMSDGWVDINGKIHKHKPTWGN